MNANIIRCISRIPLLLGVVLLAGCHKPAPSATEPANQPTTAAATENPGPEDAPPALSREVKGVIKLAQAGLSEEVILAYIANRPAPFNLQPDEIIYLNKAGLSLPIITAMIQHQGPTQMQSPPDLATFKPLPAPSATAAPPLPPVANLEPGFRPPAAGVETPVGPGPMPPMPEGAEFYPPIEEPAYLGFETDLADYGTWLEVDNFGRCWQPAVAHQNHNWRPYCDGGHWIYTDCGWYWQSEYPWGWAAFHYGRWQQHARHGWIWVPDRMWGPAWVSWRTSAEHCGWAPLPPGARFRAGVGLMYQNRRVRPDFEFGLDQRFYIFVPARYFCDTILRGRLVPGSQTTAIYRSTKVSNHYQAQTNGVSNNGVDYHQIARTIPTAIPRITLRSLPANETASATPEHVAREGNRPVLYRRLVAPTSARTAAAATPDTTPETAPPQRTARSAPQSTASDIFNRYNQTETKRSEAARNANPPNPTPPMERSAPETAPAPGYEAGTARRTAPNDSGANDAGAELTRRQADQRAALERVQAEQQAANRVREEEAVRRARSEQEEAERAQIDERTRREQERRTTEERARAEEQAKRQADEEHAERTKAEEQRRRTQEQQAAERTRVEEQSRRDQERRATEERARTEEQSRRQAEQQAAERARVEEQNRRDQERRATEERARVEEQSRRQAEQQAAERARVEEQNRRDQERRATEERARAEEQSRRQAEQQAAEKAHAEERARQEAAERARNEETKRQQNDNNDREKRR